MARRNEAGNENDKNDRRTSGRAAVLHEAGEERSLKFHGHLAWWRASGAVTDGVRPNDEGAVYRDCQPLVSRRDAADAAHLADREVMAASATIQSLHRRIAVLNGAFFEVRPALAATWTREWVRHLLFRRSAGTVDQIRDEDSNSIVRTLRNRFVELPFHPSDVEEVGLMRAHTPSPRLP
jgi:hypothetical protein